MFRRATPLEPACDAYNAKVRPRENPRYAMTQNLQGASVFVPALSSLKQVHSACSSQTEIAFAAPPILAPKRFRNSVRKKRRERAIFV